MTTPSVSVDGAELEYAVWGSGTPEIVMLHDGLGSIDQWRDTPARVADACGTAVMVYNRPGHGGSTPVPDGPWPTLWLHDQTRLLTRLLEALGIVRPVVVGHSDGGSIALLHALGEGTDGELPGGQPCRAVVAIAPHSFVESVCVDAIAAMRRSPDRTVEALSAFHRHPAAVFEAWSGVWVSGEFGRWDIRPRLGAITVPTWIVQGDADRYATTAQLYATAEAVGDNASAVLLPGVGHLVHHEDVDAVVDMVAEAFTSTVDRSGPDRR